MRDCLHGLVHDFLVENNPAFQPTFINIPNSFQFLSSRLIRIWPSIHTSSNHHSPEWPFPPLSPNPAAHLPHPHATHSHPPPPSHHHYLACTYPNQPFCTLCHQEFSTNEASRKITELPCSDIFQRRCIDNILGEIDGCCPPCEYPIAEGWCWPLVGEGDGRGFCQELLYD